MKEREKRGSPRVPYISEVVCEGGGTRLVARTSDLSSSGVFIHSQLCSEAGSVLKLTFSIPSTQIETVGEVCYSIPYIGMGVRFLDLRPDYRAAIDRLIEDQQTLGEDRENKTQDRQIILSGVEPVDKLLGGLDRGHLYLTHGDASGKSLFGIEFLIEGLKRGQPGVLIAPLSKEDAVRRFARLGYDCAKDIRSGTLVLFTYSYDTVEQVQLHRNLAPLLQELGPILDETSPERIVFDPVDNLLASATQEDLAARARELAVWVRSFGATVVLVANEENCGVLEILTPSVKESFRFDTKEYPDRVVRFIAFEKSSYIQDQAVRVDPSRGISLLEDHQSNDSLKTESASVQQPFEGRVGMSENIEEESPLIGLDPLDRDQATLASRSDDADPPIEFSIGPLAGPQDSSVEEPPPLAPGESKRPHDVFFAMLDELQDFASSLDPEAAEVEERQPSA